MLCWSLKTIRREFDDYLRKTNKYESTLESLQCLRDNNERIHLISRELLNAKLFPLSEIKLEKKTETLSESCRTEGNKYFAIKKYMKALKQYTAAIGYAPKNSKELALAFANRSAVTIILEAYDESILDIDRALSSNFPENCKYKLFERKGKALLSLGKCHEAEETLRVALELLKVSSLKIEKQQKIEDEISSLIIRCKKQMDIANCSLDELSPLHPKNGFHEKIESASSVVNVAYSVEMGRHIIAIADIHPGDVLAIEKPFASVLLPDSYLTHCFMCQKRKHCLVPCPHCPKVFYCSEECLERSWKSSHCIECSLLPTLLAIGCNKMELLALRILLSASGQGYNFLDMTSSLPELEKYEFPLQRGFKKGKYLSSDYITTHNLETNSIHRNSVDILSRVVTAACLLEILDMNTEFFKSVREQHLESTKLSVTIPIFDTALKIENDNIPWYRVVAGGLLVRYLESMPSNAHEISEMYIIKQDNQNEVESVEIGAAVYPFLSLINHSCDPNVVRHSCNGNSVVLRAIQRIKCGEQIFDNYGYHHAIHDLAYRREVLKNQYFFKCECVACIQDWPLYNNLPEKDPIYFSGVDALKVEKSSVKFKTVLKEVLEGDYEGKLPFLYSHLLLLQENLKRPWKEFSECQETIKQCLSLFSNYFIEKNM